MARCPFPNCQCIGFCDVRRREDRELDLTLEGVNFVATNPRIYPAVELHVTRHAMRRFATRVLNMEMGDQSPLPLHLVAELTEKIAERATPMWPMLTKSWIKYASDARYVVQDLCVVTVLPPRAGHPKGAEWVVAE